MSARATTLRADAPWHRQSWDRFVGDRLPALLAERLPLSGYRVESVDEGTCRVWVALAAALGEVEVCYDLPRPSAEGVFRTEGGPRVVVPQASTEHLDRAEVRCVGELLLGLLDARLGEAPRDLPWDEGLLRGWLPLDTLVADFIRRVGRAYRPLNWLDGHTLLRRIELPPCDGEVKTGHRGRVCPLEVQEGPRIGRLLSVAVGARIRDGMLVVVEGAGQGLDAARRGWDYRALGLTACMVPFLEHSDTCRVLMGVNLQRQWLVPPDPEPALVRTGLEPDAPGFWCGRNLLTAYLPWGEGTYEDAVVVSESCAFRLGYPTPLEPGDKLCNRHGAKGVVSRILPDAEMPHLPDGRAVDIVYNSIALHTRLNFGQVREALMGRVAEAEGRFAEVAPLEAPDEPELHRRLAAAGLPEGGMERLTDGPGGPPLERPSLVGVVYWGKLMQRAADALYTGDSPERAQGQGYLELYALRDIGAVETALEHFNTCSAARDDAPSLPSRVAAGPLGQASPPSPLWSKVAGRLAAAGIEAELSERGLSVRFAEPEGEVLRLALPVPHPWLPSQELARVGIPAGYRARAHGPQEYVLMEETNARMARMLEGRAPASLAKRCREELEESVRDYLSALLTPQDLGFTTRTLFSARAVATPGAGLRLDQVAVPEEMAWGLFGPALCREVGAEAVAERDEAAVRALDALMARSWVVVNRPPTLTPVCILAFHPVRAPGRVLRIHPLVCRWLNADFDGDQLAVFLPVTEGGQREAEKQLSVAGHLARDPGLLDSLCPTQEPLWALAQLSTTDEGRREIAELADIDVPAPEGYLTRHSLSAAMRRLLDRDGLPAVMAALERLEARGFELCRASGASISPFFGAWLDLPAPPTSLGAEAWKAYAEEVQNHLSARTDYESPEHGLQLLAAKSGARGVVRQLAVLVGGVGCVVNTEGELVPSRHGFVRGMTAEEVLTHVVGMRRGLVAMHREWAALLAAQREDRRSKGFGLLARAMRARRPGMVFAQAAATGEVDPLADADSRFFVGLRGGSLGR